MTRPATERPSAARRRPRVEAAAAAGSRRNERRGGFFLIIVLIVVAVATMAVYSFTELMVAYDDSAYLAGDLVQARVNVDSATAAVRVMLSQPRMARQEMGGLYNNPQRFQAVTTSSGSDGATPSNYTVVAPGLDEYGRLAGIRYGLQDESARLNVNTLTVLEENSAGLSTAMSAAGLNESAGSGSSTGSGEAASDNLAVSLLMSLPQMTEDTAQAILDWIDEDDEPREFGAEAEFYATLPTPYEPANGPLQSVEELLLVRGVTPTLLFGVDANRNGVVDADEQQRFGAGVETPGALGWAAYLTVHGAEVNEADDGTPRVNVNQDDLELLYDELSATLGDDLYASFIVAYRVGGQPAQSGSGDASASEPGGGTGGRGGGDDGGDEPPLPWSAEALGRVDLSAGGGTNINQILDLIGAEVTIGEAENGETYASPFTQLNMASYMPLLMDYLTTQEVDVLPGRINLNECPAELLYGIPFLSTETVDTILEARQESTDDPNRRFETWPLVEGLVSLQQMRTLLPLVTGGGDVYRAQIVGYFEQRNASHRSEVIIDATSANPKVVAMRDLSHLGRGFDLSVLGVRTPTLTGDTSGM